MKHFGSLGHHYVRLNLPPAPLQVQHYT